GLKVVDLHSDIFTDIAFRRAKGERHVLERIHLPRLKQGGVIGMIGVFWVEPIYTSNKKGRFLQLVRYVLDDLSESTQITIVSTAEAVLNCYRDDQFFIYLGIEGLAFLEEWDGNTDQLKIKQGLAELD